MYLVLFCENLIIIIKILKELSDISIEEIYERKLILNSRQSILNFELEDFEKLKNLDFQSLLIQLRI